jgi:alpha-beta hydrolase superfamily lysophospholipase
MSFERKENPGVPAVIYGHSMGSYLAQALLIEAGAELHAAILSASSGKPNALASAGRIIARAERARLGPRGRSRLLNSLSFEAFNKAFKPNRTAFDWLSRDEAEVDKYVADPLCGFVVCTQLWVDVLDALTEISRPDLQARIPKGLPVYVLTGSDDPVSDRTKSLDQLVGAYRRAGLTRVTYKIYSGGRHEMVNERNRDEVLRDLVTWLNGTLS